jgi:hypothetical protein
VASTIDVAALQTVPNHAIMIVLRQPYCASVHLHLLNTATAGQTAAVVLLELLAHTWRAASGLYLPADLLLMDRQTPTALPASADAANRCLCEHAGTPVRSRQVLQERKAPEHCTPGLISAPSSPAQHIPHSSSATRQRVQDITLGCATYTRQHAPYARLCMYLLGTLPTLQTDFTAVTPCAKHSRAVAPIMTCQAALLPLAWCRGYECVPASGVLACLAMRLGGHACATTLPAP